MFESHHQLQKASKTSVFGAFFVAKTLKMVWVKMWVNRLTHTLTHTRIGLKSTGEEAFAFSPVFWFCSAHMTCAMKLPIVCAASSCFCLVAWV